MCGCNKRSPRGTNSSRSAAHNRRPVRNNRSSSLSSPRGNRIIDRVNRGPKRR